MNRQLVSAIRNKYVLRFIYNGKERIVEPQTYGISQTAKEVLRARQIGGWSQSGESRFAKLFDLEKISGLKMTKTHFTEALRKHNPSDSAMTKVFATLPARSTRKS